MERLDALKKDIADYWSERAATYAADGHERNRELWKQDFVKHVSAHYPDRRPEEIRILDLDPASGFSEGMQNRMDAITGKLTASYLVRPMLDLCILDVLGADAEADTEFAEGLGKTEQQGGSQFLVKAVKRGG